MPSLTRRELIRLIGGVALLAQLPGCGDNLSADKVFTSGELDMLRGLADAVIPEDDTPGGSKLGVVEYIETLLAAFAQPTPAIFAGGPFSDRNPFPDPSGQAGTTLPANDFATFVELDRVSDAAWRQYVVDLATQLKDGLAAAIAMGSTDYPKIYDALPDEFRSLVFDLVTEAAWAAPEYGGNPGGAGWKLVHFEGDTLPLGYTQWTGTAHVERADAPFSTANPSDPEPLTADVHQLLALVVQVLGGRAKP